MRILLAIALLLRGVPLAAQPAAPDPVHSVAALREDLSILQGVLQEAHGGLQRFTPPSALERRFAAAGMGISSPMSSVEFYRVVAQLVGVIRDGHTYVAPPAPVQAWLDSTAPQLPLRVAVRGDQLYVLRDLSSGSDAPEGSEIVSIGGIPSRRILSVMRAATRTDGEIATARDRRIEGFDDFRRGWRFNAYLVTLLGLRAPYHVVLRTPGGRARTIRLVGAPFPELARRMEERGELDLARRPPAELEWLEGRVARVTIRTFGSGYADLAQSRDMEAWLADAFAQMNARGTHSLILDVRGNTGGQDELGRILLSYFVDGPFRYYEELRVTSQRFTFGKLADGFDSIPSRFLVRLPDGGYRASGLSNWGIHPPREPRFTGAVYVLMNGESFSTTSEFLSHMHARTCATLVGGEAGGGYYGNTSGWRPLVTLPNSGVRVAVPILGYWLAVPRGPSPTRGVRPDLAITPTVADRVAGRDPVLARAIRLARSRSTPTPGRCSRRIGAR